VIPWAGKEYHGGKKKEQRVPTKTHHPMARVRLYSDRTTTRGAQTKRAKSPESTTISYTTQINQNFQFITSKSTTSEIIQN
jgi:hypothetical protein